MGRNHDQRSRLWEITSRSRALRLRQRGSASRDYLFLALKRLTVDSSALMMLLGLPLSAGMARKNASSASTPPAEAPMPTMGR